MTTINGFSCKLKGRNLGSDIPHWVRKQYEIEDAEYLTQIFSVKHDRAPTLGSVPVEKKAWKLSAFVEPEADVLAYLGEHASLFDVLKRSASALVENFGQNLMCEFDLLEEGGKRKLFVKIPTKLSADEALPLLDQFDKKWWFKEPIETRRKLEFILEFQ